MATLKLKRPMGQWRKAWAAGETQDMVDAELRQTAILRRQERRCNDELSNCHGQRWGSRWTWYPELPA